MTTKPFRISASGLKDYMSCRRKYVYGRKYAPVDRLITAPVRSGKLIHEILAAMHKNPEMVPELSNKMTGGDLIALMSLKNFMRNSEFEIVDTEVEQFIPIGNGVELHRIIDVIVRGKDGLPVLLDYKITSKPWASISPSVPITPAPARVIPQAMSIQGYLYLIPPPQEELDRLGLSTWAKELVYAVSSRSTAGVAWHLVSYDPEMDSMIRKYASEVKEYGFPEITEPNYDFHCNYCFFKDKCFFPEESKDLYVLREK